MYANERKEELDKFPVDLRPPTFEDWYIPLGSPAYKKELLKELLEFITGADLVRRT